MCGGLDVDLRDNRVLCGGSDLDDASSVASSPFSVPSATTIAAGRNRPTGSTEPGGSLSGE